MVELAGLTERLRALEGLIAHRVRTVEREGHFLTFRLAAGPESAPWRIRVESIGWRIEQGSTIVVGHSDDPATWTQDAAVLNGQVLAATRLGWPSLETAFEFGDVTLRVAPVSAINIPQAWPALRIWTPTGEVITVGPGASWSVRTR